MNKSKKTTAMSDEAAFESIRARAERLDADDVVSGGTNYDDATSRVLGVLSAFAESPVFAARIRLLPPELFDSTCIDELPVLTQAVQYANQRATTAGATTSDAMVPAHLVVQGTEMRGRMMRLVSYYFADHPTYIAEIADIRSGTGHLDLAMDISRLQVMIKDNLPLLEQDQVNYRAEDVEAAPKVAKAIRSAFNAPSSNAWADRTRRAFTLLVHAYGEVRDAGLYVFRADPTRAAWFMPLRSGGRRGKKANAAGSASAASARPSSPSTGAPALPTTEPASVPRTDDDPSPA